MSFVSCETYIYIPLKPKLFTIFVVKVAYFCAAHQLGLNLAGIRESCEEVFWLVWTGLMLQGNSCT